MHDFLTKPVSLAMAQQDHRVGLYQGIADVRGRPAGLCEVHASGSGSPGSEHWAPVAHSRREDPGTPPLVDLCRSQWCLERSSRQVRDPHSLVQMT